MAAEPAEKVGSVLLVDDDPVLRAAMARDFRGIGWIVHTAGDCEEALTAAAQTALELAVIDLAMPGRSGLELLTELRAARPSTQVVVVTGYCSVELAVDAIRLGAVDFLTKPAHRDDILSSLRRGRPALRAVADEPAPSLADAEQLHVDSVLAECEGNVSRAARQLGIHRRSLQRRLRRK